MKEKTIPLGFISIFIILLFSSCITKNATTQEAGSIKTNAGKPQLVDIVSTEVEVTSTGTEE